MIADWSGNGPCWNAAAINAATFVSAVGLIVLAMPAGLFAAMCAISQMIESVCLGGIDLEEFTIRPKMTVALGTVSGVDVFQSGIFREKISDLSLEPIIFSNDGQEMRSNVSGQHRTEFTMWCIDDDLFSIAALCTDDD
jgi:hypothetical protein